MQEMVMADGERKRQVRWLLGDADVTGSTDNSSGAPRLTELGTSAMENHNF